jgi:hypothetical protein
VTTAQPPKIGPSAPGQAPLPTRGAILNNGPGQQPTTSAPQTTAGTKQTGTQQPNARVYGHGPRWIDNALRCSTSSDIVLNEHRSMRRPTARRFKNAPSPPLCVGRRLAVQHEPSGDRRHSRRSCLGGRATACGHRAGSKPRRPTTHQPGACLAWF